MLRKRVTRGKLLELFAQLPSSLVGMEACSGAHHWARELERLGHRVGIMAPRFVVPYRKSQKNDGNDAGAICEAVSRPSMRHMPVQSAEQQGLGTAPRAPGGYVTPERVGCNCRLGRTESRPQRQMRRNRNHLRFAARALSPQRYSYKSSTLPTAAIGFPFGSLAHVWPPALL